MGEIRVTILGSNSAVPAHGRHPSSQLLQTGNGNFLIDCGEGTQFQLLRYKLPIGRIRDIFITHLHGDHVFGLPPLITTWNLQGRERPLTIWSPPGLREFVEGTFRFTGCKLAFPIHWRELDHGDTGEIMNEGTFRVTTFPLLHRVPTMGYRFWLCDSRREGHAVPKQSNVTEETEKRNMWISYAYCSDTAYSPEVLPHLQGVDLLYHEATFTDEHRIKSVQTGHSTGRDAASIALRSKAGRLLLGHFSARYRDLGPLLDEAREVFANTFLAEEGTAWHVTG